MKKLLLLAVALLGTAYAQAQTITADDVKALKGKGDVNIAVALGSSGDAVRDVQFSFVVPTGLNLGTPTVGDATTDAGAGAYAVAISDPTAVTGGNKYTVVVYSEDGEFFNDGTILNIPVTIPTDYADLWTTTSCSLEGIAYTVDDATETAVADDAYSVLVGLFGDVDKNKSIGVGDISGVADLVANGTTSTYADAAFAADTDGNNSIGVGDISAIASYIANGSWPTE